MQPKEMMPKSQGRSGGAFWSSLGHRMLLPEPTFFDQDRRGTGLAMQRLAKALRLPVSRIMVGWMEVCICARIKAFWSLLRACPDPVIS